MLKKIFIVLSTSIAFVHAHSEQTVALRSELARCEGQILAKEENPTLFALINKMVSKAKIKMPRYVTIFDAQGARIVNNQVVRETKEITAYIDIFGDLYICKDILTRLSYEQIEGILAIAVAEKAYGKPEKLTAVGLSMFCATLAGMYAVNKKYELHVGKYLIYRVLKGKENKHLIEFLALCSTAPALITTAIMNNYFQKGIDFKAAELADINNIIDGIKGICKIYESYEQENIFSRLAGFLRLKKAGDFITYPIRSFNKEERINYLTAHSQSIA